MTLKFNFTAYTFDILTKMMTPSAERGAQEHRQSKLLELNLLTCSETQSSNRCQDLKVHFALENWPYGGKFNRIKSLGVQKHRVLLINNQNQKASRVEKLFTKARRVNSHPKQPSRVQGCDTEPYPQKPMGLTLLEDHGALSFQNRSLLKGLSRQGQVLQNASNEGILLETPSRHGLMGGSTGTPTCRSRCHHWSCSQQHHLYSTDPKETVDTDHWLGLQKPVPRQTSQAGQTPWERSYIPRGSSFWPFIPCS